MKFSHEGNALPFLNGTAAVIPVGQVVQFGAAGLFGVVTSNQNLDGGIAPGDTGIARTTGVWDVDLAAGSAFAVGDQVSVDLATGLADVAGVDVGMCTELLAGQVRVLLNNLPGSSATR